MLLNFKLPPTVFQGPFQVILLSSLNCNYSHYLRVKALSKVRHLILLEHPWEKSLMVNYVVALTKLWQNWNGNHSSTERASTRWVTVHTLNTTTNSPSGFWWVACKLPVSSTVLSAALRGYVRLNAALSASSCLGLTLWLTDAPINHAGQGGLMRLVISLIPVEKNSLLEWETLSLTQHWFWFTSIYFNHLLTGTRAWKEAIPIWFF